MQVIPSKELWESFDTSKDLPKNAGLRLAILKEISKGEYSEKDLAHNFGFGSNMSYVSKEVKFLKAAQMVQVNRIKKGVFGRGPHEKIIDLTDNGVLNLLPFLDADEFFKMIFFLFDDKIDQRLNVLTIDDIRSEYEKSVLHNSSIMFIRPANVIEVLENFKNINQISMDSKSILYVLQSIAENPNDSPLQLEKRIQDQTMLHKMYQNGLLIQWYKNGNIVASLSQLGFLLLIYLIYRDTTKSERDVISQISHIMLDHKNLFPHIFQNWSYLTQAINENMLIIEFVNFCFNRYLDDQIMEKKEEFLRLASSQNSMEKISHYQLKNFYKCGIKCIKKWAKDEKCKIPFISLSNVLEPPIAILARGGFTVDNFPLMYGLKKKKRKNELEKILRIKHVIVELDRLQHFTILSQLDFLNDFVYHSLSDYVNSDNIQSTGNVIAFQFFTLIRTKYPEEWNELIQKEDNPVASALRDWYQEWVEVLKMFEKEQFEKIEHMSIVARRNNGDF